MIPRYLHMDDSPATNFHLIEITRSYSISGIWERGHSFCKKKPWKLLGKPILNMKLSFMSTCESFPKLLSVIEPFEEELDTTDLHRWVMVSGMWRPRPRPLGIDWCWWLVFFCKIIWLSRLLKIAIKHQALNFNQELHFTDFTIPIVTRHTQKTVLRTDSDNESLENAIGKKCLKQF